MKTNITSGAIAGKIVVNKNNTDEQGMFTHCLMLQEVSNIYDRAIIETFGRLDFSTINVSRYHIDFHQNAVNGDTLSVVAQYSYSQAAGLLIGIKIYKMKTRKKITILTGDFTFAAMPNRENENKNHKTELCLYNTF